MKTNRLLFAVPILALGMASCSNDDEVKPQNIITGEAIKTSLAISVPSEEYSTRQSADITQNNANFRGISGMMLYPMSAAPTDQADNALPKVGQALGEPENFAADNSHHIYKNVQLPIGATHFLLYGVAKGEYDTPEKKFMNGILTRTLNTDDDNTSNINFALEPIITLDNLSGPQTTFVNYLNVIVDSEYNSLKWSEYTSDDNLSSAYKQFTLYTGSTHNRAGSAMMIKQHVQDLYDKMTLIENISTNGDVKGIAVAVKNNIQKEPFAVSADVVSFSSTDEAITKFPQYQNLPDGAALLTFNSSDGFSYLNKAPEGGAVVLDVSKLTYPADLQYYTNSPVKTFPNLVTDWGEMITGVANGKTESSEWNVYDWNANGWGNIIDLTTRSVALQHNMHYGVACLKTQVKCNSNTLEDNAIEITGAFANQSISVPSGGFPITGILVGGQPSSVNWNFVDNDATSGSFKHTVYDKDVPAGMSAKHSAVSSPNYTLLLDNVVPGVGNQDVVNLCVELENNSGQGFYGVNGYIPTGAKFYLIGKLNPEASGIGTITFPDANHRIYPKTGTSRVFMQDYMTSANITINSLKNAYVTIPDMRSVKLELGVSVDLEWFTGFDFDVTIE